MANKSNKNNLDAKTQLDSIVQTGDNTQTVGNQAQIALPVIEEQLTVGKRTVETGGVRVKTSVSEHPVEEKISLRDETVSVNRRPANRAVTDADITNLKAGDITMIENDEVAVVGKEARIVEEVHIGKTTTERTETVRDTVRRTDVEVEEVNRDGDPRAKAARKE